VPDPLRHFCLQGERLKNYSWATILGPPVRLLQLRIPETLGRHLLMTLSKCCDAGVYSYAE